MADNQTPEQFTRNNIDAQLACFSWAVRNKATINLNDGLRQAVREYQTDVGSADYVLFVNH